MIFYQDLAGHKDPMEHKITMLNAIVSDLQTGAAQAHLLERKQNVTPPIATILLCTLQHC